MILGSIFDDFGVMFKGCWGYFFNVFQFILQKILLSGSDNNILSIFSQVLQSILVSLPDFAFQIVRHLFDNWPFEREVTKLWIFQDYYFHISSRMFKSIWATKTYWASFSFSNQIIWTSFCIIWLIKLFFFELQGETFVHYFCVKKVTKVQLLCNHQFYISCHISGTT